MPAKQDPPELSIQMASQDPSRYRCNPSLGIFCTTSTQNGMIPGFCQNMYKVIITGKSLTLSHGIIAHSSPFTLYCNFIFETMTSSRNID
jgi:hypothetical protein